MSTDGFRRASLPRAALVALLALGVATPAHAEIGAGARDSLVRYVDGLEAFGFTGQVVVAEGDSIVVARAMGRADGKSRPVGGSTAFAAGSITKSFTAALVVRLVSEGRFTLDTPLDRLLPGVPADKAAITPRQLLSHTAGLPEDAEGVFELDVRETVLRTTLSAPLEQTPGAAFGYSNAGFQLLAAIAEQSTGIGFPRLVDSLLMRPSHMRGSGVGSAFARGRDDVALGRNEWSVLGSPLEWKQPWAGSGAGDLVTTALDLHRWARTMQGAGPLTESQLDTLMARHASVGAGVYYGFGLWLIQRDSGDDLVSIGGDIGGYHAAIWLDRRPPHRIVVITSAGERWGRRLAVSVAQRALWLIAQSRPVRLPPVSEVWPEERLDALAGTWRLAPSGRLSLVRDGAGLRMELAGRDAMTLAQGPDSSGARAFAEARTEDLLHATAAHDDSAWGRVLLPVERHWAATLAQGLAAHEREHGRLIDAALDGTIALPWLKDGLRTYARLHSNRGDTDLSFAWLSGGLIDVAIAEGRPAPVILPVAPLAEGGLGAYDLLDDTVVRIQPFKDGKGVGLRLSANGVVFLARRERGRGR